MKADKLIVKRRKILNLIIQLEHQTKLIKDLGENSKVFLAQFKAAFLQDFKPLLDDALKPVKARSAKQIIQQIEKYEKITPELLDEIRRVLKK